MRPVINTFGYDRHSRNRGLEPMPFQDGVTKLPGYGGGDTIPALLEPGESVVTKTATAGNEGAIAYMNAGGKIPGFATGITSIGSKIKAMNAARKEKLSQNPHYQPMGTAGYIGEINWRWSSWKNDWNPWWRNCRIINWTSYFIKNFRSLQKL